jgi:membrane associated rhomboid family serine protease
MSLPHPATVRQPSRWRGAAVWSIGFVALLWAQELLDTASGHRLDGYGITPRDEDGLVGIAFAPLLHANWAHLEANSLPALVLGFLVLLSGVARGLTATAVIWIVSGFGVWLFSPPYTLTLGASGLIFGWLVYLIVRGAFTRRTGEIVLGVTLFLLYGGLLWGVLPGQAGVSWQGHLFGAIGGAIAAYALGNGRGPRSV